MKEGLKKQMADKAVGLNTSLDLAWWPSQRDKWIRLSQPQQCVILWRFDAKRDEARCKYFGWSNEQVDAEMVRLNILKATEEAVGFGNDYGG
jgi:hypothetical protein